MIVPTIVNTGVSVTEFVLALIKDGIMIKHNYDEAQKIKREIEKYKGLRSRQEATKLIIDVAPIKIYGQECAKRQCKAALSGCLENTFMVILLKSEGM